MTNNWYDYRGYRINIRGIYETTETRLARSDYRSKVAGTTFTLDARRREAVAANERQVGRILDAGVALDMAQGTVDAIVDSLE